MIQPRYSEDRGRTQLDWLDSRHTFSFDQYYDPKFMGFRQLRVINEDRVEPSQGFGTHGHRDMEIVTYVLEGALEHADSMGNRSAIRPGEVQRMTAGTGVTHSEYNASASEPVHLLQIWLLPERRGLTPGYEQRAFDLRPGNGTLRLVAARDGRESALTIHQDVALYAGVLGAGQAATHRLQPGRHAWLQVARGAVRLNGNLLKAGDGAAASGEEQLEIQAESDSELLLFDLA